MKNPKTILCLVLLIFGTQLVPYGLASHFSINIKAPARDYTEVHQNYIVKGEAHLPIGSHLWVLARRTDFDGYWWPQGEGKVNPHTKEWKVTVTFGNENDVGWDFDVAVIVVSDGSHQRLKNYRSNAMESGHWPPIRMPEVLSAPKLCKFTKDSH